MNRVRTDDPVANPLSTPSGRIELFSERIDGFGYDDCPGHPTWIKKRFGPRSDLARRYLLCLLANQPATRLHSQFDYGPVSQAGKVNGLEKLRMHPEDAGRRGISQGDTVQVFLQVGTCLASADISDALMLGVSQLATGAWYRPDDPGRTDATCRAGNPNAVTRDFGASRKPERVRRPW